MGPGRNGPCVAPRARRGDRRVLARQHVDDGMGQVNSAGSQRQAVGRIETTWWLPGTAGDWEPRRRGGRILSGCATAVRPRGVGWTGMAPGAGFPTRPSSRAADHDRDTPVCSPNQRHGPSGSPSCSRSGCSPSWRSHPLRRTHSVAPARSVAAPGEGSRVSIRIKPLRLRVTPRSRSPQASPKSKEPRSLPAETTWAPTSSGGAVGATPSPRMFYPHRVGSPQGAPVAGSRA